MAKEYIERDALIKAITECTAETWGKGLGRSWWSHSVQLKDNMVRCINNQDAADVVEVVRCKDCKHYKQNPWNKETDMLCQCYSDWHTTEPNDFCSYGERKEETT